jgi:hypothetical protein
MRVTNLLVADPLTGGRTIAARHLLPLRMTDLIRNAALRWGGIDRCGQQDGKKREDQAHVEPSINCLEGAVFLLRQLVCKLSHFDSRYYGCNCARERRGLV